MESRSSTAIRGISGDEDAANRDLELVAAARAGSNAGFEQLQSRYSRRLYGQIQVCNGADIHQPNKSRLLILRVVWRGRCKAFSVVRFGVF